MSDIIKFLTQLPLYFFPKYPSMTLIGPHPNTN